MEKEYILCAAIHYDDGGKYPHQPKNIETGMVFCGRRHHNCFPQLAKSFPDRDKNKVSQGFITSHDRYVNRIEGAQIAFNVKQTEKLEDILFSEDLY